MITKYDECVKRFIKEVILLAFNSLFNVCFRVLRRYLIGHRQDKQDANQDILTQTQKPTLQSPGLIY